MPDTEKWERSVRFMSWCQKHHCLFTTERNKILLDFAESEVQREREECAKVAEERSQTLPIDSDTTRGYANGRQAAAHAIRSRGAK